MSTLPLFFAGASYFVGAHVAELLNKETFNLYASLNRRHIATHQADRRLTHWLIGHELLFPGTTSVTLVGADTAHAFIDDWFAQKTERQQRRCDGVKRLRENLDEVVDSPALEKEQKFACCGMLIDMLAGD